MSADEGVQRDPARHDVATRLLPAQVDRLENLGFDEGQLVPAPRAAEGPAAVVVAIALEAAAGDRVGGRDADERALGVGRRQDRLDAALARFLPVRLLDRKPDVDPRDEPAFLDRPAFGKRAARNVGRPEGEPNITTA